ncbi:MAG: zinc-dependent alcohol dehydrogenase family protein [Actinomycetota bacterium]|nr:zinc-dependent alcohol dehydrogenase family protein [Actinomycetota bacterium]
MRAAVYHEFAGPITIEDVADPVPSPDGVVVRVMATGLCRSDWHGWMGHDRDIDLPHVPGHELAGIVVAVGSAVRSWDVGDRVTVPFVAGCGSCPQCISGNPQVCDDQFQPGFTAWGSFAEFVALRYADNNLVALPGEMGFAAAARLGCRFTTAFRAVRDQGRIEAGEWMAVHGCGGVGLSAVMIASAAGARVAAVDIDAAKLRFAAEIGAEVIVDAATTADVPAAIRERTGGAHLSIDAIGSAVTCRNSILSLRKRGRHVQIGLLPEGDTPVPMDRVVAWELEIRGSHGMQAHRFGDMLATIRSGAVDPERLIGRRISLTEAPAALAAMDDFGGLGITIIDRLEA